MTDDIKRNRLCALIGQKLTSITRNERGHYVFHFNGKPRMIVGYDDLFDGNGNFFECGSHEPAGERSEQRTLASGEDE